MRFNYASKTTIYIYVYKVHTYNTSLCICGAVIKWIGCEKCVKYITVNDYLIICHKACTYVCTYIHKHTYVNVICIYVYRSWMQLVNYTFMHRTIVYKYMHIYIYIITIYKYT